MNEFKNHGYQHTSMDKIAASAKVSKRTVYNHFSSKESLFSEILVPLFSELQEASRTPYQRDVPVPEQLREMLNRKLAWLNDENYKSLARVAFAELINQPDKARTLFEKMSQTEESLVKWISEAIADGKLKPCDPAFAAEQLYALVKSFAFWPQLVMGQPALDEQQQQRVIDSAIELFMNTYGMSNH